MDGKTELGEGFYLARWISDSRMNANGPLTVAKATRVSTGELRVEVLGLGGVVDSAVFKNRFEVVLQLDLDKAEKYFAKLEAQFIAVEALAERVLKSSVEAERVAGGLMSLYGDLQKSIGKGKWF